ncbi:Pentatricopeptide repeat-containing protein [Raphanus sativus]|nr:Pentatricopeptide repeat-containing protein [Raphanus sativus]
MESRGLKPDVYTYTVIISGYAKGGLMNEAQEILAEAKKKHERLSPVTYHSLIRGYCKMKTDTVVLPLKALDWEKAEMLFEEMKQKGLHLNAITQGLIRAVKEMQTEGKATEDVNLLAAA